MENKVTFTTTVKEEICASQFEEWQMLSLLAGFVKVNGTLNLLRMSLNLRSENSKVAKMLYSAFKELFGVDPSSSYTRKMKLDKRVVYGLSIDRKVPEILERLQLMKDGMPSFPQEIVLEEKLRYFIAGAFLASGSVNSPSSKNYHLQMVIADEADAKYFLKLLNRFRNDKAMDFKMIQRGNRFVLYLKKADQIATFLSIVQAYQCMMTFENVRIEKDFFNSDNRMQICYNANYQKTIAKASEQVKEIRYLKERFGDALFSEKEALVADARLQNDEASLTQISALLQEKHHLSLSKSGINHILGKIHQKYVEAVKNDRV